LYVRLPKLIEDRESEFDVSLFFTSTICYNGPETVLLRERAERVLRQTDKGLINILNFIFQDNFKRKEFLIK